MGGGGDLWKLVKPEHSRSIGYLLCGISSQARKVACVDSLGVLYGIMTGSRYESPSRNTTERSPAVQPTNRICWNLRSSVLAQMSDKDAVSWFQKIQLNVQNSLLLKPDQSHFYAIIIRTQFLCMTNFSINSHSTYFMFLYRALWYNYVTSTNKMHTFQINGLINSWFLTFMGLCIVRIF
jgi:hypothetical protein